MPIPSAAWNTTGTPPLLVAPCLFAKAEPGRMWQTTHLKNGTADVFGGQWARSLWRFVLSGLNMTAAQALEWDAFHDAVRGKLHPFLFRVPDARFALDNELIGTGDGIETEFQLKRTRSYQGYSADYMVETVKYPVHNYPNIAIAGTNAVITPTKYVQISVAGSDVPYDNSTWTINRLTGVITFATPPGDGDAVRATCDYFVKVHGQDFAPIALEGGQTYVFGSSAQFFEANDA